MCAQFAVFILIETLYIPYVLSILFSKIKSNWKPKNQVIFDRRYYQYFFKRNTDLNQQFITFYQAFGAFELHPYCMGCVSG